MKSEKKKQRDDIKALFQSIQRPELLEMSNSLSKNLFDFIFNQLPSFINLPSKFLYGAFAPMNDEVLWYLSFDHERHQTAFPAIVEGRMAFVKSKLSEQEMQKDFGVNILCPPKGGQIVTPDILIVPGRAFSLNGDRLGRGKGFYDRFLNDYKYLTIGVCLEAQIKDFIVTEEHDHRVDYIVTEKRVIETSRFRK